MGLFLFCSFVLHAFCFYLFQVVYPPSERFTPNPARITFLSGNDSNSRAKLTSLEDRVVYFDSSGSDSAARVRIEDYTVAFKPSFAGYAPKLRELPETERGSALPPTIEFHRTDLPAPSPPAPAERPGPVAERTPGPRLDLEGQLAGRLTGGAGDWEWTPEESKALEGRHAIIRLAVDEKGAVRHALVHRGIESGLDAGILARVRAMRLAAAPGGGLVWGTLRLEW